MFKWFIKVNFGLFKESVIGFRPHILKEFLRFSKINIDSPYIRLNIHKL